MPIRAVEMLQLSVVYEENEWGFYFWNQGRQKDLFTTDFIKSPPEPQETLNDSFLRQRSIIITCKFSAP